MPSYNTRSRTKNAESNDDDAAQKKSGNANIESTPASVAKKPPPSTSATGKAKTTKTKPGPISAEARAALIAGINKGDKYLDQFETNDEIKQLIKSIVPVRVTGKNRDPLLTKLKQALRIVGLGVGVDKLRVTQEAVNKANLIEKYVYFEHLTGYAPVSPFTDKSLGFDIIEFLESEGTRFFHGKSREWLQNELGRDDSAYEPCYRSLVLALRKQLQYDYSSWRALNARHADVDNLQPPQDDDPPAQSACNRATAAAATAAAATMPSSMSNVILPETPRPPSSVGNGEGNQFEILKEMLLRSEREAERREREEKRREREEKRRDEMNKAMLSQLMNTNVVVQQTQDRVDNLETGHEEIKTQVAKSAKKTEKMAARLRSIGVLSPDSEASTGADDCSLALFDDRRVDYTPSNGNQQSEADDDEDEENKVNHTALSRKVLNFSDFTDSGAGVRGKSLKWNDAPEGAGGDVMQKSKWPPSKPSPSRSASSDQQRQSTAAGAYYDDVWTSSGLNKSSKKVVSAKTKTLQSQPYNPKGSYASSDQQRQSTAAGAYYDDVWTSSGLNKSSKKVVSAKTKTLQSQPYNPKGSYASSDQQRQHEEDQSSMDSEDKSNVTSGNYQNAAFSEKKKQSTMSSVKLVCSTCQRYADYVRSGSYGQHTWLCVEPECKNYRKTMSTSYQLSI
ncbi:hypothetical protein ACHAWC_010329 [Mediolabrus comicus]